MNAVVDEAIGKHVTKLRGWMATVLAISASAVALTKSEDRVTAILLCVVIVLGVMFAYWVMRHIENQEAAIADCNDKHVACTEALRKRDIAIALLYRTANGRPGGRRKADALMWEVIMGDEAKSASSAVEELIQTHERAPTHERRKR